MGRRGDPNRSELKIDVAPEEKGDFLLTEPGEQKGGEKLPLAIGGDFEKRCSSSSVYSNGNGDILSGR
jgi:hypothetical protein